MHPLNAVRRSAPRRGGEELHFEPLDEILRGIIAIGWRPALEKRIAGMAGTRRLGLPPAAARVRTPRY